MKDSRFLSAGNSSQNLDLGILRDPFEGLTTANQGILFVDLKSYSMPKSVRDQNISPKVVDGVTRI